MSLHYEFPWIANISQVLPLIADRREFIVAERDYGTIINYVMQTSDTFPQVMTNDDAILHELRGIIFDKETGKIKARRLHKFFNYGEKMYGEALDISQRHVVMEKVDGSMITPIFVDGQVRWGTKMGITEIGMAAETFVHNCWKEAWLREAPTNGPASMAQGTWMDYNGLAFDCESLNATPIFEYCSTNSDYQIVVRHKEEKMILLHIRDKITGKYMDHKAVEFFGEKYGVPVVKVFAKTVGNLERFLEEVRQQSDYEGVVIKFADGHMVKVKTDWYLALHRAKAAIEKEKDVALIIINDSLDDMLPLQPPEMQARLCEYRDRIIADLTSFALDVGNRLSNAYVFQQARRDFAITTQDINHGVRSACFALWDNQNNAEIYSLALEWGKAHIAKACSSNTQFEKVAYSILQTARWKEVKEIDS